MESEDIVTKILVSRGMLNKEKLKSAGNSSYDLGKFLKKTPKQSNMYDDRFVFIQ